MCYSVGVGFIWIMMIGLLFFSYVYLLNDKEGDEIKNI